MWQLIDKPTVDEKGQPTDSPKRIAAKIDAWSEPDEVERQAGYRTALLGEIEKVITRCTEMKDDLLLFRRELYETGVNDHSRALMHEHVFRSLKGKDLAFTLWTGTACLEADDRFSSVTYTKLVDFGTLRERPPIQTADVDSVPPQDLFYEPAREAMVVLHDAFNMQG